MSGRVFGSVFDADTGSALISGQMGEEVITQTGTGENPPSPPALIVNRGTHQRQH